MTDGLLFFKPVWNTTANVNGLSCVCESEACSAGSHTGIERHDWIAPLRFETIELLKSSTRCEVHRVRQVCVISNGLELLTLTWAPVNKLSEEKLSSADRTSPRRFSSQFTDLFQSVQLLCDSFISSPTLTTWSILNLEVWVGKIKLN